MMSLGSLLIGFLTAVLYCAIVIFIAWVVLWVLQSVFGIAIEGNVLRWGKIIVALICAIVLLTWLFAALGGVAAPPFPRLR